MWLGVSGAVALGLGYAARGRSSSWFAPSVWHGPRRHRAVALTFDDGPSPATPALLRILGQYGARATFFQVGANVRRLPEVARHVLQYGHELGNHTTTHPYLYRLGPGSIRRELEETQAIISDVAGRQPRLFRAPYGVRWFGLRAAQRANRLLGVMWTIIGRDWALPAQAIAARLLRGAAPGAILCLHDGRVLSPRPDIRATLEAVRRVVPALLEQGYRFMTVSQLLCQTP